MMKDVPEIFYKVYFYDEKTLKKASNLNYYDIVVTDSEKNLDKTKLRPNAIIAYIRGILLYLFNLLYIDRR